MAQNNSDRRLQAILGHCNNAVAAAPAAAVNACKAETRVLQRAVIVDGARTPFVKSFGDLITVDSIGLGCAAISGLLSKTRLNAAHVDGVIMGNVVVSTAAPNLARECVLDLGLPRHIVGTTVSIACLSGLEAIATAVQQIETGRAHCLIAGGSDSLSNGELTMPRQLTRALAKYSMGGGNKLGWRGAAAAAAEAGSPLSWLPVPNSIAERSTGRSMGYHADLMAEINSVSRQQQDALAVASHNKAAAARAAGKFAAEIVPVTTAAGNTVSTDNLIRERISIEAVSKLGPAFRPATAAAAAAAGAAAAASTVGAGTVNAASSSALTDGASAVLVMSSTKAIELGYAADVVLLSYVKTAIEPYPQLLLAPALAIPAALAAAALTVDDIDLWEIHEAFAAQVLATIAVLADDNWCRANVAGAVAAVGVIPLSKLNVNGGSLALGHPFAATGGRLVTSLANELRRSGKRYGLISICAAGGIGGVAILERIDA